MLGMPVVISEKGHCNTFHIRTPVPTNSVVERIAPPDLNKIKQNQIKMQKQNKQTSKEAKKE